MVRDRIALITSLIVCAVFVFSISTGLATPPRKILRVGYIPILSQLPLIITYENDRIDFETIKLKLIKYNSYTSLEAAIRVGAVDVADIPAVTAFSMVADGITIKIFGATHEGGAVLIGGVKGGMQSLRGALIGVPGLDSAENLKLHHALESLGQRPGLDFKTIDVPFLMAIPELKKNHFKGLFLPEPFGTLAEGELAGFKIEGQEEYLADKILDTVLVGRSEFINSNQACLSEWIQGLVRACEYLEKDIMETGGMQTALAQEKYFGFSKEIVKESLGQRKGGMKFVPFLPKNNQLRFYLEKAMKIRILTKSVDLDHLTAYSFMKPFLQNGSEVENHQ